MANYIYLDSGHAKSTPGKRSPDSSFFEWEFNNAMQYKLKPRLEALGFTVILTNPNPDKVKDIALTTRANTANTHWNSKGKPNALFISLHANAAGNGGWYTARGCETYTAKNASTKSKNAAKHINDNLFAGVKAIDAGFKNRGVKQANFTVIYKAVMPAVLIEYAFYDNKSDLTILKNKRDALCEATLKGICKYFGVTYKAPSASKPVTETTQPIKPPATNVPSTTKPFKNGTYNVKAKVTASALNVRAGRPGSASYNTILGQFKKDQVVTVGYCLNGWFGVTINGKQGFISGDYVQLML